MAQKMHDNNWNKNLKAARFRYEKCDDQVNKK